jgi:hypothetical protein
MTMETSIRIPVVTGLRAGHVHQRNITANYGATPIGPDPPGETSCRLVVNQHMRTNHEPRHDLTASMRDLN